MHGGDRDWGGGEVSCLFFSLLRMLSSGFVLCRGMKAIPSTNTSTLFQL